MLISNTELIHKICVCDIFAIYQILDLFKTFAVVIDLLISNPQFIPKICAYDIFINIESSINS
jgi:hypothetical protein